MTGDVKADLKLHETCLAKFAADQEIVGLDGVACKPRSECLDGVRGGVLSVNDRGVGSGLVMLSCERLA